MKRFRLRATAVSAVVAAGALVLTGWAGAKTGGSMPAKTAGGNSLPTLNVALTGTNGVSVSGAEVSGAVNVVSTFTGKVPRGSQSGPVFGLVRLNPGVAFQQAFQAVQSHGGNLDALTPYGALLVSASAPGSLQTC